MCNIAIVAANHDRKFRLPVIRMKCPSESTVEHAYKFQNLLCVALWKKLEVSKCNRVKATRMGIPYEYTRMGYPIRVWAKYAYGTEHLYFIKSS